ncbi:MAG TPA: DUF401 family protein [Desulfonatronum sp.]|nr:DUF401 family protein [Desulfonatronum sp.]
MSAMETFMDINSLWPLLKISLVFAAILLGIRWKAGIGASILLGSLLLALLFRIDPGEWFAIGIRGILQEKVLLLAAIVLLILYLSDMLERSGQGRRLMQHVSRVLVWPRLRLIFFPALIGLLPMPGGAVFSAPMIKEIGTPLNVPPRTLVLLNYWFRHVWELCWPLYPGIILAAYIADLSLFRLLSFTWPSLALTIGLGWLFYLRPKVLPLEANLDVIVETSSGSRLAMLIEALPLLIAVIGALFLEGLLVLLKLNIPVEWGFVAALIVSIGCTALQNRLGASRLWPIFKNPHALHMLFLVASIFMFKAILEEGGVVRDLAGSVTTPAALFWISLILPFIVGIISGLTVAFVGGTLPLILGLAAQLNIDQTMSYIVLTLFSGYIGVLVSPLHVCLILSCGYFHTSLEGVLKKLLMPCALMLLAAMGYALLLIRGA